jgi:hypothetical protein
MLALNVGVREAARQMGFKEDRVMQWSKRYHWIRPISLPKLPVTMQNDVVSTVSKAADTMANFIETNGKKTRFHLSRATMKASKRFSQMNGDQVINRSDSLVQVTNAASKIHGWESASGSNAVNLQVLSGGRAVVQVAQKQD